MLSMLKFYNLGASPPRRTFGGHRILVKMESAKVFSHKLTLLHSERPKLYTILAFLSAIGLTTYQTTL